MHHFAASIILVRLIMLEIGKCIRDLLLSGSTIYVSSKFANDAFGGAFK